MASGPITSWEIGGETVKTVSDFILGGSKITADGDCSHEIKRRLLLGRKVMTNLDSILKSRDITLPTKWCLVKVCLVKAMVFPVVMYGCESSTVKKAEHRRIDAFELWCWRRLLKVPWTARRSNQSILKEISPGCSSEGLMLKLKLQYFGHLMQSWLIGKDSDAGRDWGQEEKGTTEDEMAGWHHRLNGHEFEWTLRVGDGQGGLVCCNSWVCKESDTTEQLNWTDHPKYIIYIRDPSWCCTFCGFGSMYNDMYSLQYNIEYFNVPKNPLFSIYSFPPSPQPLTITDHFTVSLILLFPKCHIIGALQFVIFSNWPLQLVMGI